MPFKSKVFHQVSLSETFSQGATVAKTRETELKITVATTSNNVLDIPKIP